MYMPVVCQSRVNNPAGVAAGPSKAAIPLDQEDAHTGAKGSKPELTASSTT